MPTLYQKETSTLLDDLLPEAIERLSKLTPENKTLAQFLIEKIPKVDLHVHAEAGSLSNITLARKLAKKHKIPFPEELVDQENQRWLYRGQHDFMQFIHDFLQVSSLIQTAEDVEEAAYDYYRQCHVQNVIFSLPGISWIQCKELTPASYLQAHANAIAKSVSDFGEVVTTRLRYYLERHLGVAAVNETWQTLQTHTTPLITTIGLAGSEQSFPLRDFSTIYQAIQAHRTTQPQWFSLTAHMEEHADAKTIQEALPLLDWIGHGRKAAEDDSLVAHCEHTFEICPLSDVAVYPKQFTTVADHIPLKTLINANLATLNSDDPSFFGSITEVYLKVHQQLNVSYNDLLQCTINGVNPLKKNTLEEMRQTNPDSYKEYKLIEKVGMLKVLFFQIYWKLLSKIADDMPTLLQQQLFNIDLKSPLVDLVKIQGAANKHPQAHQLLKQLIHTKKHIASINEQIHTITLDHVAAFQAKHNTHCRL